MKIINYFVLFFTLAISSTNAADWDNGGISTYIKQVTVLQDGEFYIHAADDLCDGDKENNIGQVRIGREPGGVAQTREGISMLLSLAMTAQIAKKGVVIYADNSGNNWGCLMGAIKVID